MKKIVYALFTCLFLVLSALVYPGVELVAAASNDEAFQYFRNAQAAHNPDDQIMYYQKALERDPNFIEAYINLSIVYMEIHKFEQAIDVLQKAYKIDPEHWLVKKNLVAAYVNLGVDYGRSNRITDEISAYHEALILDPHNPITLQNLSSAYNNLGVQSYYQGELQKACQAFQEALGVNPNNHTARDNLQRLFPSGCSPVNIPTSPSSPDIPTPIPPPDRPESSLESERIREIVVQAITRWQNRTGIKIEEREQLRIVNEYLASVEECGTNARSLRTRDIEEHVSVYLDNVREGHKPQFVVCDPLQW